MHRIDRTILQLIITIAFLLASTGQAQTRQQVDEISLGIGKEKNENIAIYRLGLKKNFNRIFLTNQKGWLSGYFEGSLNLWHHSQDDIYAIALSPVFVYYFGSETNTIVPYIEGGIGVSFISQCKIADVNMSTAFQFEDRIGGGIRTEKLDANFRYMHYSNGSIAKPNDGIDSFIVTLSYRF